MTNIELKDQIESRREELKRELNITDADFDLLVKEMIVEVYARTGLRITEKDPIFAVLLTNKKIIDYNFNALNKSLEAMPEMIGDALTDSLEKLNTTGEIIGSTLQTFSDELESNLKIINLKARDDLETKLLSSVESITKELKETKQQTKPKAPLFTKIALIFTIILLILNMGLTGYIFKTSTPATENIEYKYNLGLLKGYNELKSTLSSKDYQKVEKTLNRAIDSELKGK